MKHELRISLVIITMFIVAQFIGLYVANFYSNPAHEVPLGMGSNNLKEEYTFTELLPSIIFSFIIAISIIFLLMKFKATIIMRIWFFSVVVIALTIAFKAVLPAWRYSYQIILFLAIYFTIMKVFKRDIIIHNFTELFVYPGIAVIFIPLLSFYSIIILLIIISIYDMWAVWHSGIMQKIVKFQMDEVKVIGGFFVPYMDKKLKDKMRKLKKKSPKSKKTFKVNVAILGGGDVIFPIITSGIMLGTYGVYSALFVIGGATAGLSYLQFFADKKKFYPAMPYITAGIFLGMGLFFLF